MNYPFLHAPPPVAPHSRLPIPQLPHSDGQMRWAESDYAGSCGELERMSSYFRSYDNSDPTALGGRPRSSHSDSFLQLPSHGQHAMPRGAGDDRHLSTRALSLQAVPSRYLTVFQRPANDFLMVVLRPDPQRTTVIGNSPLVADHHLPVIRQIRRKSQEIRRLSSSANMKDVANVSRGNTIGRSTRAATSPRLRSCFRAGIQGAPPSLGGNMIGCATKWGSTGSSRILSVARAGSSLRWKAR